MFEYDRPDHDHPDLGDDMLAAIASGASHPVVAGLLGLGRIDDGQDVADPRIAMERQLRDTADCDVIADETADHGHRWTVDRTSYDYAPRQDNCQRVTPSGSGSV